MRQPISKKKRDVAHKGQARTRTLMACLSAMTLTGAPALAVADQPAPTAAPAVVADNAGQQPGQMPEKWPMRWDFGLGLGYNVLSPNTGLGNAAYRTDGTQRNVPDNSALLGLRATAWILNDLGLQLEGKWLPNDSIKPTGAGAQANIFGLRVNALYQFLSESEFRPFVLVGVGTDMFMAKQPKAYLQSIGVGVADKLDADGAVTVGTGFKWQALHDLGLRLDLRWVTTRGVKDTAGASHSITGNYEGILAIEYSIGGKPGDDDNDGILNPYDKCPDQPEDKDGFEDNDGCPDPDNDKDGIPDVEDKCPNDPEDKDGFEDYDGCPDLDNDKDGIPDTKDKCPLEPETKNGYQDEDGCPDSIPDRDKDGIPDFKDKCPDQPENKNGYQDDDGCPDDPDSDNDGIPDSKDKCPKAAETKNGYQDEDGCPDEVPADLQKLGTEKIGGLVFDKDGKLEDKKSAHLLQPIAEVLVKHEGVKLILKLTSHSVDAAGAKARADACKAFLVSRGVEVERLETEGESTLPVAEAAAAPAADAKADPKDKAAKPAKKGKAPAALPDELTMRLKV